MYEIEFMGVKELLSWIIGEGESLKLFAYMAWNVWNQRNKVRMNIHVSPLHQVAEQSKLMLAQYQANLQVTEVQVSNENGGTRWQTPTTILVKINFDGAVFKDLSMSGIGEVIRDNNGSVLASCSEKITQAYKADEIEALAALKALSLAHKLGFQSAILEDDSLDLIQALKFEEHTLSPLGLLVEDVKVFVEPSFV